MRTYQNFSLNPTLTRHQKELNGRKKLFILQLLNAFVVILAWGGVAFIGWLYPSFFIYPYLRLGVEWSVLVNFWPLLLWCLTLITVTSVWGSAAESSYFDERLLGWGLITGNFAALWEEFGYRGAFIYLAMIFVAGLNWLMGTAFVWLLFFFFTLGTIGILMSGGSSRWYAIVTAGIAVGLYHLAGITDPWYWVYEAIIMPIVNFLSFGSFTVIMDPAQHNQLFVMGGILANTWFRDGHKYQGWLGFLDSWIVGFVFLYATMTYGLLTAVVLHALWNTTIHVAEYLKRKFFG